MGIIKTVKLVYDYITRDETSDAKKVQHVLKDVDLDIEAGSFVAIIGHNGCGKSTLARNLNALLVPTSGSIWVDGYDTSDPSTVLNVRQSAGMVFQNPDNQIIASVVEEDVAFGPENTGVPTDEIWARVADSLEKAGMTAYRYHSPNRLSGGQKQRVAIAGILAMQPACMILDEATAMLDPIGRKEVLAAVHQLNRELGVTVLLITHYMEEAADADRVIVMNAGEVFMDGSPTEVFSRVDELESIRLTVPQTVLLADRLRKAGMPVSENLLNIDELAECICSVLEK